MREKTVLVIDDDEMNLQIAKMVLEKKVKCRVICVDNGREGIEILRNERVNLVLLDIMMPEFDGIETLKEIRADDNLKNIPVMMLTAMSGVENLKKVYTLGVKDYIKKPFMPADLISRVNKKFAELEPDETILLLGTDIEELKSMQKLIEKIFDRESVIATNEAEAQKILNENKITLVVADAEIKFVDGFRILNFVSNESKLAEVPFTLTTSEKILELVEKINAPKVEVNNKNKLANVVTSLIGYELDVHV